MNALVTGATGFVGSHVARQLLEAGHSARALYRSRGKLESLGALAVEPVAGDLSDSAALERACAGCDVVFHVAAKADYWKDGDRDSLWRVNVEGTRNLLAAAKAARVKRVILTSSASTLGVHPGAAPADETFAFNLPPERFYYAWTKLQAEKVAAEFVADGLDVAILNPTVVIGPGDLNAISGSFVIETARYQWLTPVASGGLAVIDVRDVARAHLNAVERAKAGERYILNAANLRYREWFRLIAAACEVRPPLFTMPDWMLPATAAVVESLRALGIQTPMDGLQTRLGKEAIFFDGSKANRELGAPQIDIARSLRDTYQWYAENGYIKPNWLSRLLRAV